MELEFGHVGRRLVRRRCCSRVCFILFYGGGVAFRLDEVDALDEREHLVDAHIRRTDRVLTGRWHCLLLLFCFVSYLVRKIIVKYFTTSREQHSIKRTHLHVHVSLPHAFWRWLASFYSARFSIVHSLLFIFLSFYFLPLSLFFLTHSICLFLFF